MQIFTGVQLYVCDVTDAEVGGPNLGQQNRHKITATLGLVVHAAGIIQLLTHIVLTAGHQIIIFF